MMRRRRILLLLIAVSVLLSGCGKVKRANELYRQANREHGDCTIVSIEEAEDRTVVVLHDTLQDFDYKIRSYMSDINIDGSSFGSLPHTDDGFRDSLTEKVVANVADALDEACSAEGLRYELSNVTDSVLIIYAASPADGQAAALKCAEALQTQNPAHRLDGFEVSVCANEDPYDSSEYWGSVTLPELVWCSAEDETIEYYTQQAKSLTRTDVEYVGQAHGVFADTGADLNRVVHILGSDVPTDPDSEVTFYYFRLKDGTEFYLCDFSYQTGPDNDSRYSWYTNYPAS